MSQINIHITNDFKKKLHYLMKQLEIDNQSQAIRQAVEFFVEKLKAAKQQSTDFGKWRGMALKSAPKANSKFNSDDDLWTKK